MNENLAIESVHGTRQLSHRGVKARAFEEREVIVRAKNCPWAWCKK